MTTSAEFWGVSNGSVTGSRIGSLVMVVAPLLFGSRFSASGVSIAAASATGPAYGSPPTRQEMRRTRYPTRPRRRRCIREQSRRPGCAAPEPSAARVAAAATVTRTASPSVPPTCWAALSTADATPMSAGCTPEVAPTMSGTKLKPSPSASTRSGPSTALPYVLSASIRDSHKRAIAASSGPMVTNTRGRMRAHEPGDHLRCRRDADGKGHEGEAGLERAVAPHRLQEERQKEGHTRRSIQ